MAVQPDLCRTWSETRKTGFLATRLINMCFSFRANVCRGFSQEVVQIMMDIFTCYYLHSRKYRPMVAIRKKNSQN